jgi:hypothetical protein
MWKQLTVPSFKKGPISHKYQEGEFFMKYGWFSGLTLMIFVFVAQTFAQEKELLFTPAELTSMLSLFNQTQIKGSDVEVIAPLGAKLRFGYDTTQRDSTRKIISLKLSQTETQICLNVLNNSTVEARFADLILGMKKKLNALASPVEVPTIKSTFSGKK